MKKSEWLKSVYYGYGTVPERSKKLMERRRRRHNYIFCPICGYTHPDSCSSLNYDYMFGAKECSDNFKKSISYRKIGIKGISSRDMYLNIVCAQNMYELQKAHSFYKMACDIKEYYDFMNELKKTKEMI